MGGCPRSDVRQCVICGETKSKSRFLGKKRGCLDCVGADQKKCRGCGEIKPKSQFFSNKSKSDGKNDLCGPCDLLVQKERKYGITREEIGRMMSSQGGRCRICGVALNPPYIDHDHQTGKVRGLLCNSCNRGLGHFSEDPDVLFKAFFYLLVHSAE